MKPISKPNLFVWFLVTVFLLFIGLSPHELMAQAPQLKKEFLRNGEVYLAVSHEGDKDGSYHNLSWIYRFNDPANELGTAKYPLALIKAADSKAVNSLVVDLRRYIFTLSNPDVKPIGDDYQLIRQVLDASNEPIRSGEPNLHVSHFNHWFDHSLKTLSDSGNAMTEARSDYGNHAYPHHDTRGADAGKYVYRTITDYPASNSRLTTKHNLVSVRQCESVASEPSNPVAHMPNVARANKYFDGTCSCKQKHYDAEGNFIKDFNKAEKDEIVRYSLPPYKNKKWYAIPNKSWYSTWKVNPNKAGFVVYCDRVTGDEFHWRKHEWIPQGRTCKVYQQNSATSGVYAITYNASIEREIRNGCLDGCSTGRGNLDITEPEMICHTAFMPYTKPAGGTDVRVYTYTRHHQMADGAIKVEPAKPSGGIDEHPKDKDNANKPLRSGWKKNDVKWVGVSRAKGNKDYVYYLGDSNISYLQKRAQENTGSTGGGAMTLDPMDIKAVSVSNQWDEEGGIIFAYNKAAEKIYEIKMRGETQPVFDTYMVKDVLSEIGAKSSENIDEIAADGFGRMYISLTFPSVKPSAADPAALGYDVSDAYRYQYSNDTGEGVFYYTVPYRKTVWQLSFMGNPAAEVAPGGVKLGDIEFERDVTMPVVGWQELDANISNTALWQQIFEKHNAVYTSGYRVKGAAASDYKMFHSKLAVINAPTPPGMLSLFGGNSYIDIIGAYAAKDFPEPTPQRFSTGQETAPRQDHSKLELSELYFFMVENYPLQSGVQDPNAKPDNDADNRLSGFISTIRSKADGDLDVDYKWKIWKVTTTLVDAENNYESCILKDPELVMAGSDGVSSTEAFAVLFAMMPENYILTCVASMSYYDYSTVEAGQTYSEWSSATNIQRVKGHIATPTAEGVDPLTGEPLKADPVTRLDDLLKKAYNGRMKTPRQMLASEALMLGYNVPPLTGALDSGKNYMAQLSAADLSMHVRRTRERILSTDTEKNYAAIELATASGTPKIEVSKFNFQVERCNDSANHATTKEWYKSGTGASDTASLFAPGTQHGVVSDHQYVWAIDRKEQSIFYADLTKEANKGKLETMLDGVLPKTGNIRYAGELKWEGGLPRAQGLIEYHKVVRENGVDKLVIEKLPLGDSEVATHIDSTIGAYSYLKNNANLPVTDPFEATITIRMFRLAYYKAFLYDDKGVQLSNRPIWLPVPVQMTGQGKILVVDFTPPQVAYSRTCETKYDTAGVFVDKGRGVQIEANANEPLKGEFYVTVRDNNWWDTYKRSSLADPDDANIGYKPAARGDWKQTNRENNLARYKNLKNNVLSSTLGANMETMYNPEYYEYVVVRTNIGSPSFSMAPDTWQMTYTESHSDGTPLSLPNYLGYGEKEAFIRKDGKTGLLQIGDYKIDTNKSPAVQGVDFSQYFAEANASGTIYYNTEYKVNLGMLNLVLPANYAENTPGYEPYKFTVEISDSSGNYLRSDHSPNPYRVDPSNNWLVKREESKPLNVLIHVYDKILPEPYFTVREFKGNASINVPEIRIDAMSPVAPVSNNYAEILQQSMFHDIYTPANKGMVHFYDDNDAWEANNLTGLVSKHTEEPGYVYEGLEFSKFALPYKGSDIVALNSSTYPASMLAVSGPGNGLAQGSLVLEDNVEVLFHIGAIDNSGSAVATMTVKFFDINGAEQTRTIGDSKLWNSPGLLTGGSDPLSRNRSGRVVFRRGSELNFPMVIPIEITVEDNARSNRTYNSLLQVHRDNWSDNPAWDGGIRPGVPAPNKRTFKTSIPVFGSTIDVRTLDKHLTPRR